MRQPQAINLILHVKNCRYRITKHDNSYHFILCFFSVRSSSFLSHFSEIIIHINIEPNAIRIRNDSIGAKYMRCMLPSSVRTMGHVVSHSHWFGNTKLFRFFLFLSFVSRFEWNTLKIARQIWPKTKEKKWIDRQIYDSRAPIRLRFAVCLRLSEYCLFAKRFINNNIRINQYSWREHEISFCVKIFVISINYREIILFEITAELECGSSVRCFATNNRFLSDTKLTDSMTSAVLLAHNFR